MSLLNNFSRGFLWNQVAKIFHMGGTFLLGVLLARYLGAEEFGLYSALFSIVAIFSIIGSLGFETLIISKIGKISERPGEAHFILTLLFGLRLISVTLLSLALYYIVPLFIDLSSYSLNGHLHLIIPYLFFFSINNLFTALCIGLFRVREVALIRSLSMGITLALALLLLEAGGGIKSIIVLLTLTGATVTCVYIYRLRALLFKRGSSIEATPTLLKFGIHTWLSDIFNYILGKQMDVLLILYFLKETEEVAFYEVAFVLSMAIGTIMTAGAEGVSLAAFSEIRKMGDERKFRDAWTMHFKMDVILLVIPLGLFVWSAGPIIEIIYGSQYERSVSLFTLFMCTTLFIRLWGGGTTTTILLTTGKERVVLACRFGFGLLNLLLNLALIPLFGVIGAVAGTGISVGILSLTEFMILKRQKKLEYPLNFTFKVFSTSLLIGFTLSFIPVSNAISLLMVGILYIGAVLTTLGFIKLFSPVEREYFTGLNPPLHWVLKKF